LEANVPRHFLTAEYVDSVERPEAGELWIADTEIRGFGLRVWASDTSDFKAFAIRKNDRNGRTIRKSFQPWNDDYRWREILGNTSDRFVIDENGGVKLGSVVESARRWARYHLDVISGRELSDQAKAVLDAEHNRMRDHIGAQLCDRTLGHLVEIILKCGDSRGWSENYCDRLRHAFNQFDPNDDIRSTKVVDLADGRLSKFVADCAMSSDNLRLLRSLLKVVVWNVHQLGGPAFGKVLPARFNIPTARIAYDESMEDYLSTRKLDDLLGWLHLSNADWRSRSAIALACLFWAPCSRVFRARWTEILDNLWFPYRTGERRYAWAKWERIDEEAFKWLQIARQGADSEGVNSDFWFPRKNAPDRPIVSVYHVWFNAMQDLQWGNTTLAEYSKRVRRWQIIGRMPSMEKQTEVAAKLAQWPGTRRSAEERR
jgi:hypothetical protein